MMTMANLRLALPEILVFSLGAVWAVGCDSQAVTGFLVAAILASVVVAAIELVHRYQHHQGQGRHGRHRPA